jgi:trehalose 6-phosphate phosphatase
MKYLFTPHNLKKLRSLNLNETLFAFDYDGTLAKIVKNPSLAKPQVETDHLIHEFSQAAQVAIISGRSVKNLKSILRFSPKYLIGNHGIEGVSKPSKSLNNIASICRIWKKQLNQLIEQDVLQASLEIEDKIFSLSIHYRNTKNRATAKKTILKALNLLSPAPRIVGGKAVFNLMPPDGPDKGTALHDLMKKTGFSRAFYVGDDDTDEDVFSLKDPRIFTVRVGNKFKSKAEYFIRNQNEVKRVLRYLIRHLKDM